MIDKNKEIKTPDYVDNNNPDGEDNCNIDYDGCGDDYNDNYDDNIN